MQDINEETLDNHTQQHIRNRAEGLKRQKILYGKISKIQQMTTSHVDNSRRTSPNRTSERNIGGAGELG